MNYFDLLSKGAFKELLQATLPNVKTDNLAAEAFLRMFVPKSNMFLLTDECIDLLKQGLKNENPYALYGMARWMSVTQPDDMATETSLHFFEQAYKAGIADAGAALSMAHAYGDYGLVDRDKAQEYINEAINKNSMLGNWYNIRGYLYGNWWHEPDLKLAKSLCESRILQDKTDNLPPNALWYFLHGCTTEKLQGAMEALPDFEMARDLGYIGAYFWIACALGFEDGDELVNSDEYFDAIAAGVEHLDAESMFCAAWDVFPGEDDLPDDPKERKKVIKRLIQDLTDAALLGNTSALLDLAEIYHDGKYDQEVNMEDAWTYLAQAAIFEEAEAYERLWAMVCDGDVPYKEENWDWLLIKGARCDSAMLTEELVRAYKAGRMGGYEDEIEAYYLPLYPNVEPAEPLAATVEKPEDKVYSSTSTDERPPLQSTEEALENYWKECVECCEQAEHILQEQDDPSPIAEMANRVIIYGKWLGQFEHMLSQAYSVTKRMAECIYEHPRLLLRLKEVELDILRYAEAVENHHLEIADDLQDEINQLKANIKAADEGRFRDIKTDSILKSDPVEWTARYEEVIDEADHEAYSHLKDDPRGMGFCFGYWHAKEAALAKRGIEWRSPHVMNPKVMFD